MSRQHHIPFTCFAKSYAKSARGQCQGSSEKSCFCRVYQKVKGRLAVGFVACYEVCMNSNALNEYHYLQGVQRESTAYPLSVLMLFYFLLLLLPLWSRCLSYAWINNHSHFVRGRNVSSWEHVFRSLHFLHTHSRVIINNNNNNEKYTCGDLSPWRCCSDDDPTTRERDRVVTSISL